MTTIFDVPGSGTPNPFSTSIQDLLHSASTSSAPTPDETAARLVLTITTSSDPSHALWQLWDAFFIAVATSTSHAPFLALLKALRVQPPTQPSNVAAGSNAENQLRSYVQDDGKLHWSKLPRFSSQWRDVHDILKVWRDWDGVRTSSAGADATPDSLASSGDVYYLHFCVFSAELLKMTKGKGEVHPVWVFYACRDVLESEGPQSYQPKAHRMTPEQVWALDVRVAATWMRVGGRTLWETNQEELRRHWAAALDERTVLWPRVDGLTQERWQLWGERLQALGTDEKTLDTETRAVAAEAAQVVEGFLKESVA
ncbi:hypothetical protein K458DRAFT_421264 [Lentithecium fluviatile CBS 122367]|uniref:Uncharacterized protein n=1 Tax=Lentithecium fluviatile CBS 122367 TaxID=1168545 RepID=A0A6G1IST8_9PLEO|nr:hypothetical protein K458DRAFT_421264 [Lentithecium fluviatile CBS 122367]